MSAKPSKASRREANNTDALTERLKSTTELLEQIAGNRALLVELSIEERRRLLKAAGRNLLPGCK